MAKKVAVLGLFALLVVIIVGISLTVYFTSKKSKSKSDGEEPSEKKPELTFDANAKKTINPQEEDSGTQEGYYIEYAGGEAIDLTLSWNNGQGFDGVVNKLIFTRYVGGTKIQDDKITEKADEIADYGSGSVTFSGSEVSDGVNTKGVNVIKAYYNEVSADNELASVELEITESDFDQVMTGEFSEVAIPVSIKEDSFKLKKTTKKTYYNLSIFPTKWFTVRQNGDIYTFIGSDGKPLKVGDTTEFKIQKYKGKNILSHAKNDKIWVTGDEKYYPVGEMTKIRWGAATFKFVSEMGSVYPTRSTQVPYTVKSKTEFTASKMRNKYVNKSTGELGSFSNSYWRDTSKPFSEHMEACKAKCNQFDNCKAIQFVSSENYCSMTNADGNNSNITNSDNRVEIHIKPS